MADYSELGVPSPEWAELMKETDSATTGGFAAQGFLNLTGLDVTAEANPADPGLVSHLQELQRKTDAAREVESAKWWEDTGQLQFSQHFGYAVCALSMGPLQT